MSRSLLRGFHHLGRVFAAHGHDVRLMSQPGICPGPTSRRRRMTNIATPRGIAEAATRPTMRFVELKSQDQLDMCRRFIDREIGWSGRGQP